MVQDCDNSNEGHRKTPGDGGVQGELSPLGTRGQPQLCSGHFESLAYVKRDYHHPEEGRHVEKIHGHSQNFTGYAIMSFSSSLKHA